MERFYSATMVGWDVGKHHNQEMPAWQRRVLTCVSLSVCLPLQLILFVCSPLRPRILFLAPPYCRIRPTSRSPPSHRRPISALLRPRFVGQSAVVGSCGSPLSSPSLLWTTTSGPHSLAGLGARQRCTLGLGHGTGSSARRRQRREGGQVVLHLPTHGLPLAPLHYIPTISQNLLLK